MKAKVVGKIEVPVVPVVVETDEEEKARKDREMKLAWAEREAKIPVKTERLFEDVSEQENP